MQWLPKWSFVYSFSFCCSFMFLRVTLLLEHVAHLSPNPLSFPCTPPSISHLLFKSFYNLVPNHISNIFYKAITVPHLIYKHIFEKIIKIQCSEKDYIPNKHIKNEKAVWEIHVHGPARLKPPGIITSAIDRSPEPRTPASLMPFWRGKGRNYVNDMTKSLCPSLPIITWYNMKLPDTNWSVLWQTTCRDR